MPARKSTASSSRAASSSSGPRKFDFRKVKRDKSKGASGTFNGDAGSKSSKRTTTRIHKCVHQSGDNEGKESGNRLFVFNPRKGLNERAKEAVLEHAYGQDTVSQFNKELDGFAIKVVHKKQAAKMHGALRELDGALPEELDFGDWEDPEIAVVMLSHVDLPQSRHADAVTDASAIMLEGFTYPLYKILRELDYDFKRGVHGHDGVNRWCRVVEHGEKMDALVKEVTSTLREEGWSVPDAMEGDARDWDATDDEGDDE